MSCGRGYKWRTRHCQAAIAGREYTKPCQGTDREQAPCKMPSCAREYLCNLLMIRLALEPVFVTGLFWPSAEVAVLS